MRKKNSEEIKEGSEIDDVPIGTKYKFVKLFETSQENLRSC